MTSVMRSPSQIGVREKYLIAVADESEGSGVAAAGVSAFTLNSGAYVGSVALAAEVIAAAGYAERAAAGGKSIAAGELFRDMGRSITVVDAAGNHLALYRNVQLVSGAASEGSDQYGNIYLRVWAADGANVGVARLG